MRRSFLLPVLTFAAILGVGDAALIAYFEAQRAADREAELDRIRGAVAAHMARHVESVRIVALHGGESAEDQRKRAEAFVNVFPSLVGTALSTDEPRLVSPLVLGNWPEGTASIPVSSPAARSARAGTAAADDPFPAPNGETVVAIWVPFEKGAAAGIFRMDRLAGDVVDAAVGKDAPFVLRDSRGRDSESRGNESEATIQVPVALPGLSWTLAVPEPRRERSKAVAFVWSVIVLSAALWSGFALSRRRAVLEAAVLETRARKLAEMADVEQRERTRIAAVLDNMQQGVVQYGPQGEYQTANLAGIRLLGMTPEFVRADGTPYPEAEQPAKQALAKNAKVTIDDLFVMKDGKPQPLHAVASPLTDAHGAAIGAVAMYSDVAKQREWEDTVRNRDFALTLKNKLAQDLQEAKTEEDVLRRLTARLDDALTPAGVHIFVKKPGVNHLRAERTTAMRAQPGAPQPPVLQDHSVCPVLESGERLDPRDSHERVQPCLGRISPGGVLCAPLVVGGQITGVVHLELANLDPEPMKVEVAFDLIQAAANAIASARLFDMVKQAAIRDPLTSLFNRRYFDESARVMVAQSKRHHKPMGVLMIDIDHFKRFNDTHGHDAGDVVLREFARSVLGTGRQSDVMVRYGGEEFAVLLPETALPQARVAAERILEATRRLKLPLPGLEHGQVTVSIGVAAFPEHGDTPEVLVKEADKALYEAKSGGRNRVVTAKEAKVTQG